MEIATAEVSHGVLSNENRRIHRVKRSNSIATLIWFWALSGQATICPPGFLGHAVDRSPYRYGEMVSRGIR